MSKKDSNQDFEAEISNLRDLIREKDLELAKYRAEVQKANQTIEQVLSEMQNEISMIAKIQRKLTPTEIPNIQGFEFSTKFSPGTKYGGDYFDIFELHDKLKFGIFLSSCSGYVLSSLLLAAVMKHSAQMEARKGIGPHELIEKLAGELIPDFPEGHAASIFYGVIDRRNFELNYSCVGNIGCFLLSGSEKKAATLSPSTGPLEKMYSSKPLSHNISLGPKDRLVLLSEGIFGEKFSGINREDLQKIFQKTGTGGVHDLRNEILFQSVNSLGKTDPTKDQTVLVLEVKDKVIKLAKRRTNEFT